MKRSNFLIGVFILILNSCFIQKKINWQLWILLSIVFGLFMNPFLIEAATQPQNEKHDKAIDSTVTLIGAWTGGNSYAVYIENDIAYFSKEGVRDWNPNSLAIVDVSDPLYPHELGNIAIATPSIIKDIVVNSDFAYVVVDSAGLRIINVSDPTSPYESGFFDTDGSASGVAISGDHAYVADGTTGLRIINISDPSYPAEISFIDTEGSANAVAISGDHAFVADYSGLIILNISDPANPIEIGFNDNGGSKIVVMGDYAYMAAESGMWILDISNPANPKEIKYYNAYATWQVMDITVHGNYAYLASDYSGLLIIDISDPTNPKKIGTHDKNSSYYNDVAVSGDYAYAAISDTGSISKRYAGLKIVDISDPKNPSTIGLFPTNVRFKGVVTNGNFAYVADDRYGLRIFNIANPAKVIQTGFLNMRGIEKVKVAGNYAYVLSGYFHIIDVSDPSKPTLVGTFKHHDIANDFSINGELAYVVYSITGDVRQGLKILDISDPTNPVQRGFYVTGDYYNIDIKGDYAYALPYIGLHIFDISNPLNPIEINKIDIEGENAVDLIVDRDFAYVANGNRGLLIINISDPSNPSEIGFFDTDNMAVGISVNGDYAYVADGFGGLQIIDISDPVNPKKEGFLDVDEDSDIFYASDVTSDENHAYVAYGEYGFCIVGKDQQVGIEKISVPVVRNFRLEQNYPNPFYPITIINYTLQIENNVKLSIFDIAGREIKILVNQSQTAGTYSVAFDASELKSGIYLYKLKTETSVKSRKMFLIR